MNAVFLKLFNMSITAGWLIMAVILARVLLRKAPKQIICFLWGFAAFRLICPFSLESGLSLIPSAETVNVTHFAARPYIQSGVGIIDNAANGYLGDRYFEGVTVAPKAFLSNPINIITVIWLIGFAALLLYYVFGFINLKRRVSASVLYKDNIYICDDIPSSFILGIFKPRIYLPSSVDNDTAEYVLTHEKAHIKRGDYLFKPLGFILLSVYWFNPLCWAAYILFCRDIEIACDETVIRNADNHYKAKYSQALLTCSLSKKRIATSLLAFGEIGVKERVKNVLNYKKPALWIIIAAVIVCVILAVCFLTNPASKPEKKSTEPNSTVSSQNIDDDNLVSATEYTVLTDEYNYYNDYGDNASISLNTENKAFTFRYSMFSSFFAAGTYEETESGILLKTDDGKYYYAFTKTENAYIFDAEKSSPLPKYKYNSEGNSVVCVPDGAVFQLNVYSPIFDKTDFDIDGDGKKETCVLTYGPSSGVFSFYFGIYKDGNAIYNDLFWNTPVFNGFKAENNELKLYGNGADNAGKTVLYDISFKNGHILITDSNSGFVYPPLEGETD